MLRSEAEGNVYRAILAAVAVMMIMTPFLVLIGFASTAAGHGNYLFAKILFPFTMLSTLVFDIITIPFLILGLYSSRRTVRYLAL